MSHDPKAYDLPELSAQADVTPRTIRYYIQQGLLRGPGAPGPGAKYDDGHLLRLRLIRRLQREHLPLSEIRRRLDRLADADVARALEEPSIRSPVADYVHQVLHEKHRPRAASAPIDPDRAFMVAALSATTRGPEQAAAPPGPDRSQWDRVALSPDLELHIRRPLSRVHNKIVDKLLDYARRLLEEDTP